MPARKPKIMMITGAASGIGAATARQAATLGYTVVIADIDLPAAERVAREIGPNAAAMHLDICAADQWQGVLDRIWDRFGALDVLVNNAAIVHTGNARNVALAQHQKTMDTNFMGPVAGMLAVLPRFEHQGSGHLVTICSMTAFLPFPGIASYAAAKHALRAFHHAVALEERARPIAFTIIHPTATETPMLDKEAEDDDMALAFAGASMLPADVAAIILKAIRAKSVEVCIPAERGRIVRKIGTDPRSLREMVEKNEILGRQRLAERRARLTV